ncbi:MAG: hypothetical protein ABFR97_05275 [Thermodesulfobacteriota bacterium]
MNFYSSKILAITIFITLLHLNPAHAITAFPGAEGFGANSIGGRGGTVIKVTNLNDSGSGSLRDAARRSGARTIVFDVSGVIMLRSELLITNPFLTIAGETSPGGILVAGHPTTINTHDVIIRHMRFRTGSSQPADPETLDSFRILGDTIPGGANDAYNIIIDHCSFSWGIDENFAISYNAHDITVQWSNVSEGLANAGHPKGQHSKGLLVSGKFGGADNVSLHHNFFAHNLDRNPRAGGPDGGFTEIINNVSYNYPKGGGIVVGDNSSVNVIHNFLKRGPVTNIKTGIVDINYWDGPANISHFIFLQGNISPIRPTQEGNEWIIADGGGPTILREDYRRATPWPASEVPVTIHTASSAMAECILSAVGATAPVRDSIDARNVASFFSGEDGIVNNVAYPGDYPRFTTSPPPTDSDNDGMPNGWETSNGLNPNSNDAAGDINKNGYTNIEEYLHYLSDTSYRFDARCMAPSRLPRPEITNIYISPQQ